MYIKFLSLIHAILCVATGYGFWYLTMWFFTNQSDLFQWSVFVKVLYFLFGMVSSESIRASELKVTIKRKKDE
jgi:hypothetical protein